jgi:hypothetical protein
MVVSGVKMVEKEFKCSGFSCKVIWILNTLFKCKVLHLHYTIIRNTFDTFTDKYENIYR